MAFKIKSAKQKKALIVAGISVAVLAVGFTIAYNQDAMFFSNLFRIKGGIEEYVEEFASPTNWQPCQEIPKEAYATNKNEEARYARMKIDEYWRTADSQTPASDHTTSDLSLTWDDNGTTKHYAVINTQNDNDWELKSDGWYYYKTPLQQNQSMNSLLESVTLNCDANLVSTVTYSQDGLTGESVPSAYAGATYHLYVTMQLSDTSWEEPEVPNSLYGLIRDQANDSQYQIDFRRAAQVSADESTANGNGVNKTTENGHDVYYYRGVISDNNVIWANKCWKMIRTTAGGGTKMIYSGLPTNGTCVAQGYDVIVDESYYNNMNSGGNGNYSPSYVGYMYGATPDSLYADANTTYVFSNNVSRSGNTYTLDTSAGQSITGAYKDVLTTAAQRYHYACLNGADTCDASNIVYVYAFGDTGYMPYINIGGYNDIEDAKSAMFANTTDSTIKTVIDNWFTTSGLTSYENDLEDAVYCNDRSITIGSMAGKDVDDLAVVQDYNMHFAGYARNNVVIDDNLHPSLDCTRKVDAFTKSDTTNGNGELTYPVGLITADEATLAGYGSTSATTGNYLFSGKYGDTFTMTPYGHGSNGDWLWTEVYEVDAYWEGYAQGKLTQADISTNQISIRPVVTLKHSKAFSSGTGTSADPYIVQ